MLTPSPKRSSPSTITSPRLMPMRNSMRLSAPTPAFRSGIACCTATAQRTASTTLANSTSMPSPVVLTTRPWCSAIFGSTSSRRTALRRSSVPSSSAPISREYPATSAARIAARRRVWLMSAHRQAQARQEELAVLGVAKGEMARHDQRANGAQLADDRARFAEPTHMRVTGGEKLIRDREARIVLNPEEQLRYSLIEAPAEEVCAAQYKKRRADSGARTEPQRHIDMIDCDIRLARPKPEKAADRPAAGVVRVECQCAVDQPHHGADVVAERGQHQGGIR